VRILCALILIEGQNNVRILCALILIIFENHILSENL
jgi:hypothetical protein